MVDDENAVRFLNYIFKLEKDSIITLLSFTKGVVNEVQAHISRGNGRSMCRLSVRSEAATYNLTVVGNHRTQTWNRFYEKAVATDHQNTLITTYWNRGIGNALKVGHNEAGFQYWRGHAILDADVGLVTAATATTLTLNWTRFDSVYNTGIAAGMRPILEISCTPPPLAIECKFNCLS